MSQVTSSRGTRDRRSLADPEENASRRMGPGIAGHVRGPHFCGQAARLPPVPLDRSALSGPFLGSNHVVSVRFSGVSLRAALVISLLRGRCIPSYWVRDRGHVRGLASVGQVARLRRSSDRSTMMTPVPLNHRFRTPIFSIRSVLVISLLRALIVTIIGLPATSVRPGRTVASVRAAHSLGEPFSRNPSSIPSPPVLANLPCF